MFGSSDAAPSVLTPEQLRHLGILQWAECAGDFIRADLLLGNGFSINLTNAFSYTSLFESFLKNCAPAEQAVLPQFATTNFEFILEDLATAARVNGVLGLPTQQIVDLADRVREGLIKTVEQNHPRAASVDWERLGSVAAQLHDFSDILHA